MKVYFLKRIFLYSVVISFVTIAQISYAQSSSHITFSEEVTDGHDLNWAIEVAQAKPNAENSRYCSRKYKAAGYRKYFPYATELLDYEYNKTRPNSTWVKVKITYYCVQNYNQFRRNNSSPNTVFPAEITMSSLFPFRDVHPSISVEDVVERSKKRISRVKKRLSSGKTGCQTYSCYNTPGIYWYDDGSRYSGSSNNGKNHGLGIMSYANGALYQGEWKNHKKHGKGIMQWPDGEYYYGDWKEGVIEGEGHRVYANGDYYVGSFKNWERHGIGSFMSGNEDSDEIHIDVMWTDDEISQHKARN